MGKFISNKIKMKSAARLAAVQAIYSVEYGKLSVDDVVRDFIRGDIGRQTIDENPLTEIEEFIDLNDMDVDLFADLVRGVHEKLEWLETSIAKTLSEEWSYDRIDGTLKSVLFCGVFELTHNTNVDAKVIIKEYVDIAYAFFEGAEPKMTNAVLDRMARLIRNDEF